MSNEAFGHHMMSEGCLFGTVSPILLNDSVWRSFAYHKLPQQHLNLSIHKLDGSFFDVKVSKTATVGELKEAVEDVFSQFPTEDINISWSHVWGHFCLCYKGHKLINDKACIRFVGIKDGDQLHFVNHLSVNYYGSDKRRSATTRIQRSFRDYEQVVPWNDYTQYEN